MISPMLSSTHSNQSTRTSTTRATRASKKLLVSAPSNEEGDDFVRVPATAVRGLGAANAPRPTLSEVFFERGGAHRGKERNGSTSGSRSAGGGLGLGAGAGVDGAVDVLYSALHDRDDPESGEAADGEGDGEGEGDDNIDRDRKEGLLSFFLLPSVSTFRFSQQRTQTRGPAHTQSSTRTPTRGSQRSQYLSRADKLRMEQLRRGFLWCSAIALAVGVVLLLSALAVRSRRRRAALAVKAIVGDSVPRAPPPGPGGCDRFYVEDVWTVGFPKRFSRSAMRLVDVNRDGVPDVVFGYGTRTCSFHSHWTLNIVN